MIYSELPFPDGELGQAFEIGAVDHRTVRAWIRDPSGTTGEVRLTVAGRDAVQRDIEVSQESDWTTAIDLRLDRPAPGERFVCSYRGQERSGRLAPSPGERTGLVFGFGSCNRPFTLDDEGNVVHNPASHIYPLMQDELQREEARFLLLCGDQIYSDEITPISVRAELNQDPENPPGMSDLINAYRRIYRGYFAHPGFRALRESLPTLCIWDDHDIFDNWGSSMHESALDTSMFEAASHTYLEYQHLRNPGMNRNLPPFHYHFQYGDIGFFVLDVRGERNYTEKRLLGDEQWVDLDAFLNSSTAQEISTLFIVSTIPVAHTARWVGQAFSDREWRVADTVRDRWTSVHFLSQRDSLLHRLFAWQSEAPRRQVIILSGDVHIASAMTMHQRNGTGVIEQFISSAMTTPVERIHVFLHHLATSGLNLLEPGFRFEHHFLASENNYGLVRLEPDPEGGHRVELMIRGLVRKTMELKTVGQLCCSPPGK